MFRTDALGFSARRLCFAAALTGGAFVTMPASIEAQLRTGRGTRDFYQSEVRQGTPIEENEAEADSELRLASATEPSPIKRTGTQQTSSSTPNSSNRPQTRNRVQTSGSRPISQSSTSQSSVQRAQNSVQRASATQGTSGESATQLIPTPAPQPIPEAAPMHSAAPEQGCSDCGHTVHPLHMQTGLGESGCCDSCGCNDGGCGCGSNELFQGGQVVVDLGCGPIARIVGWLAHKGYYRLNAASFEQNGVDLPILGASGPGTANGEIPATPISFGGNEVNTDRKLGYRFHAGLWLDECHDRAIEVRGYDVGNWATHYQDDASTIGAGRTLFRPIFDTNINAQNPVTLVNSGRTVAGSLTVDVVSKAYGGDILMRKRIGQGHAVRWDFLIGYQGNRVNDDLHIRSQATSLGVTNVLNDSFITKNQFDGMALGLSRFSRWNRWSFESRFKLSAGNLRRDITIAGTEAVTILANTDVRPRGLLARATNSDQYIEDTFVVSPEVSLGLGWALTSNLDFNLGYDFLAIPKVARAGDQIQRNAAGIPITNVSSASTGPEFNLRTQSYWLQSLNFGAQWRF